MSNLAIGNSYRYSFLEKVIAFLNNNLKKEKLKELISSEFPNQSKEQIIEENGEIEDYFHSELTEMDLYSIEDAGEEFSVGVTFAIIRQPEGDVAFSFILDGFAGEGTFTLGYVSCDAPVIDTTSL